MRFGLFYLPTYPSSSGPAPAWLLREIVDQAALAEELGFTGIWLAEHHFHGFGGMLSSPAALGCAIAMRTRRLRIGTAVALLPYHHPLRLAEDYATLDVLSEGRFDFGVGTGFLRWENEVWEAPLETARAKFAEALEVILRVWQEEDVAFEGQFVRFPALTVLPRPYQRPHPPVWLAATTTPETFILAGQRGYHLMLIPFLHSVAELREKIALYHEALRAAGHDPASREVLAAYHVYVGEDRARSRAAIEAGVRSYMAAAGEIHARTAHQPLPETYRAHDRTRTEVRSLPFEEILAQRRVVAGTPAECVETLASLREDLHLTYIAANVFLDQLEPAEIRRSMERLATQVMPHLRP
ncbi:MAG TPA: LLM class flavin-dependent oxidoreductase [Chloroflexota bacterium]|nr:LLM class flavin-dependent oxidoreductase [Chloroflexota bacterium]HZU08251.1 LLM class flavin-dependent oxidoreductase [Chloroflexota bacterium]